MSLRVSLGAGGASPFRVLGPGTDPNNPGIEDIIFDANYGTMRKLQEGRLHVKGKGFAVGSSGSVTYPPGYLSQSNTALLVAAPPSGKRFYAICHGRRDRDPALPRYSPFQVTFASTREFAQGIGCYTSDVRIGALNWYCDIFNVLTGAVTHNDIYVDYLVFRNITG